MNTRKYCLKLFTHVYSRSNPQKVLKEKIHIIKKVLNGFLKKSLDYLSNKELEEINWKIKKLFIFLFTNL